MRLGTQDRSNQRLNLIDSGRPMKCVEAEIVVFPAVGAGIRPAAPLILTISGLSPLAGVMVPLRSSTRSEPLSNVPVRVVAVGVWKVKRPAPNTG